MPRKQCTPFQLNHTYLKPKLWQIIQINCMHFHCLSSLICCHVICHHIISCAVGYARFPLSSSSLLFTLSTAVIWFPAGCFPVVLESNKECLEKPIKPSSPIQFGGWIKTSQVESGPASRADGQAQGKDVFALINQKKNLFSSVPFSSSSHRRLD